MQYTKILYVLAIAVLLGLVQFSMLPNPVMASPAPSARVVEWNIPSLSQYSGKLVADSGKVYFIQHQDFGQIAVLDPATNVTKQWHLGTKVIDMVVSSSRVWFVEYSSQKIGLLYTLNNTWREWSLSRRYQTANPTDIAIYGGKIYFIEQATTLNGPVQRIGRLDPITNNITEWNIPGSTSWPASAMTMDTSGRVWFSRTQATNYGLFGGPICRLDTATNVIRTSGNVPGAPWNLIASADGKYIWFNENFSPMQYPANQKPRISRLEVTNGRSLTEWEVPQAPYKTSLTQSLTEDAMGNIYFTDAGEDQIGKLKSKGGTSMSLNVTTTTVNPNSFIVSPTSRTVTPQTNTRTTASYTVSSAVSGYFTEWNIPATPVPGGVDLRALPQFISTQDGSAFYFTENTKMKIAKFLPQYTFTEWIVPTTSSLPLSIKVWKDKAWFTEQRGNKIGALNTKTNSMTQWLLPNSGSQPFEMAIATYDTVRGNPAYVYFTERAGNRIGRLYPDSNNLTEWTVPTRQCEPFDIAIDSGIVWFTEFNKTAIARLNPSTNTFTEWLLRETPTDIAISAGKVWFTEINTGKIGCLNSTTNTVTEYVISTTSVQPRSILVSDGYIWFLENSGSRIARLNPTTKKVAEWILPLSTDHCAGIGIYGGKIWFTNYGNNKIGKFYPASYAERTVTSISAVAKTKNTVIKPTSKILTPTATFVTPTITDRTGIISGEFVQWTIPTLTSGPEAVQAIGGGEVWFTEYTKNKIGLLG